MGRERVYYIKGKLSGTERVDDIDRAEGKDELFYLLAEYSLAFGPIWTLWVTDSHGRRLSDEELEED